MFLRRASKFFHSPVSFKSPDGIAFTLSRAKLQLFSTAPSIGVANPEQDVASAAGQEKLEVVNAVGQDKSAPTLHSADAPPVLNVVIPVVAVLTEAPKAELSMAEPPKAEAPLAVQSLGKEPPVAASSAGEPAPEPALGRKKRYDSKYMYGKMRLETDEDLLKQPKGAETMKKLGLEAFLNTKMPEVNPGLCDEFLSTYKESRGQGVVQGRDIVITPEAIHKITGLPLGIKPVGRLSRKESVAIKSFATWRHADMYCLQSLRLGDDSEVISAAGKLLMQKMRLRRHGSGTVAAQILLRLQESLQCNVQPQWSAYMADHMRRAASLAHTKNRRFYFGGWLSGLIQNALPEDQVKKAAAAEKSGSKDELKKKKPVRSRAKGVKKEKEEEKAKKAAVVIEYEQVLSLVSHEVTIK